MSQLKLLHKLIHSLNKGEKKLFTQQADKHQFKQEKYFYVLYKILENENIFNEDIISNSYKKETNKSDFTDEKNYLQEQLLNTISNNTIENNIEVYILQLIVKIRSLENKGHIELALKCIRQAIKLCEETENFILLLRCLNIEQSFYPYLHENTEKTIHAQIKYNDTLETLIRINLLDKTILNISKIYEEENKIGTNESNDKLIELLNQLPREESYLFNREKANYHQIKFAVYYKTQDYKSSYSHITNTIKYMNKNLYYIYEDKWMYITALINAAHNALKLDLNEDIDIYFNQIDELIINELFKQNSPALSAVREVPVEPTPAVATPSATPKAKKGVRSIPRRRVVSVDKSPSGRERHDEKITVYLSPDELFDLDQARLSLRGDLGLAVDRGRIVRESIAVIIADLEQKGDQSILARRLRGI